MAARHELTSSWSCNWNFVCSCWNAFVAAVWLATAAFRCCCCFCNLETFCRHAWAVACTRSKSRSNLINAVVLLLLTLPCCFLLFWNCSRTRCSNCRSTSSWTLYCCSNSPLFRPFDCCTDCAIFSKIPTFRYVVIWGGEGGGDIN